MKQRKSDKYISPRRMVGLVFFALAVIFVFVGVSLNGNPDTYNPNNMSPGYTFGAIGLILLLLSVKDPKTKTEYEERKKAKNALIEARREKAEYEKRMSAYRGVYLTEQQIRSLENEIELPVLDNTSVFLGSGEVAVYHSAATRQEIKNRVIGRTGGYSGSTIRIAKGVSIRTGSSASSPVYGDVATHYEGELVLTNKRLIFLSDQKGFEVAYNAITAGTAYTDGITIQKGSHTYTLILPKADLAILAFNAIRTGKIPIRKTSDYEADEYNYDEYDEVSSNCGRDLGGLTGAVERYIEECIKLGRKDEALEVYRENYPCSLAEAKMVIEKVELSLQSKGVTRYTEEEPKVGATAKQRGIFSLDEMDGHQFEHFCANLLRKNGFSDVSVTPGSGDQGVDILAIKGGVRYAVQCKNYSTPLGNTPVQEVTAGKQFYNCHVGVVMTNSTFTPGAMTLANATGVILWDRTVVHDMMVNAGMV